MPHDTALRRPPSMAPEWPIPVIWASFVGFALFGASLKPQTIGLTVPAVLIASSVIGRPIELGLEPAEIVLLMLTLGISIVTFVGTRTNALQGAVHLAVFLACIVLIFDRQLSRARGLTARGRLSGSS